MHNDPVLFKSSGNDDLDKAVLACADGYKYGVAVAGKPAEVTWVMGYFFFWPHFMHPNPDGTPAGICWARSFPYSAVKSGHRGSTTLFYRVGIDGSVKDLAVIKSSGYNELDDAALKCAASWRFYPATQNGQPVEIDMVNAVRFLLGR
jgi:TonB family protein